MEEAMLNSCTLPPGPGKVRLPPRRCWSGTLALDELGQTLGAKAIVAHQEVPEEILQECRWGQRLPGGSGAVRGR